jgi:uncharacterized protein (TIGR02001 family)
MRNLLVLGALAAATAAPAIAQEVTISGNVALTTDYQWRNRTQSNQDYAVSGGFDLSTESGFYAGVWASSLGDAAPSIEADFYAGYAFEAGGVGLDIGAIYYAYPDDSVSDLNFWEVYVAASKEFGALGLGGSLNFDPDNETVYADVSLSYALSDAFSFSGGYGAYIEEGDPLASTTGKASTPAPLGRWPVSTSTPATTRTRLMSATSTATSSSRSARLSSLSSRNAGALRRRQEHGGRCGTAAAFRFGGFPLVHALKSSVQDPSPPDGSCPCPSLF